MERQVASHGIIICAHLTSVDSDICVLFMTSICVNSNVREVHKKVNSLGKIICVPLTGVDSDIYLLVMTPTSLY